jgi:hypothetical protein
MGARFFGHLKPVVDVPRPPGWDRRGGEMTSLRTFVETVKRHTYAVGCSVCSILSKGNHPEIQQLGW